MLRFIKCLMNKSAKKTNDQTFQGNRKRFFFLVVVAMSPFSSFAQGLLFFKCLIAFPPSMNVMSHAQKLAVKKQRALKQLKKAIWTGMAMVGSIGLHDTFCNAFELW